MTLRKFNQYVSQCKHRLMRLSSSGNWREVQWRVGEAFNFNRLKVLESSALDQARQIGMIETVHPIIKRIVAVFRGDRGDGSDNILAASLNPDMPVDVKRAIVQRLDDALTDFDPFARMSLDGELISESYLADLKENAIVCIRFGTETLHFTSQSESTQSDEAFMKQSEDKLIYTVGHYQHWRAYADDESLAFLALANHREADQFVLDKGVKFRTAHEVAGWYISQWERIQSYYLPPDDWPAKERRKHFTDDIREQFKTIDDDRYVQEIVNEHVAAIAAFKGKPISTASECQSSTDSGLLNKNSIFSFFKEDGRWHISGFGERGIIDDVVGCTYLYRLLEKPERPVPILDVIAKFGDSSKQNIRAINERDETNPSDEFSSYSTSSSHQSALDEQGEESYQARLDAIEVDLADANKNQNEGPIEQLLREKQDIKDQLRRDKGIGNKVRNLNTKSNKLRAKFWSAINTFRSKLLEADPPMKKLADHFSTQNLSTECGAAKYNPESIPKWELVQGLENSP